MPPSIAGEAATSGSDNFSKVEFAGCAPEPRADEVAEGQQVLDAVVDMRDETSHDCRLGASSVDDDEWVALHEAQLEDWSRRYRSDPIFSTLGLSEEAGPESSTNVGGAPSAPRSREADVLEDGTQQSNRKQQTPPEVVTEPRTLQIQKKKASSRTLSRKGIALLKAARQCAS